MCLISRLSWIPIFCTSHCNINNRCLNARQWSYIRVQRGLQVTFTTSPLGIINNTQLIVRWTIDPSHYVYCRWLREMWSGALNRNRDGRCYSVGKKARQVADHGEEQALIRCAHMVDLSLRHEMETLTEPERVCTAIYLGEEDCCRRLWNFRAPNLECPE